MSKDLSCSPNSASCVWKSLTSPELSLSCIKWGVWNWWPLRFLVAIAKGCILIFLQELELLRVRLMSYTSLSIRGIQKCFGHDEPSIFVKLPLLKRETALSQCQAILEKSCLQVFKRKRCEIPKLMPAVLPWDLPHEIASQGMTKRNSWEKCFTLFSSRRYHLGLFTLAVQWESKERILRMWVKGCNPHCTRLGVASVRWKILETPHLEKAPI